MSVLPNVLDGTCRGSRVFDLPLCTQQSLSISISTYQLAVHKQMILHIYVYLRRYLRLTYIYIYLHTQVCIHTHRNTYTHASTYVHECMYMRMYTSRKLPKKMASDGVESGDDVLTCCPKSPNLRKWCQACFIQSGRRFHRPCGLHSKMFSQQRAPERSLDEMSSKVSTCI